jgi:Ni,Fe-hydrogenase III large subunit
MPAGVVRSEEPPTDGYALALVESPRGENLCWAWIRDGKVERCKFRTASYCTWLAIEHAVQGEIPPDFPVINKSLNLSYAGTDL